VGDWPGAMQAPAKPTRTMRAKYFVFMMASVISLRDFSQRIFDGRFALPPTGRCLIDDASPRLRVRLSVGFPWVSVSSNA
jgi:hypothetical protein